MSGEVEKCPILHVRPKFDVFTLLFLSISRLLDVHFFILEAKKCGSRFVC